MKTLLRFIVWLVAVLESLEFRIRAAVRKRSKKPQISSDPNRSMGPYSMDNWQDEDGCTWGRK